MDQPENWQIAHPTQYDAVLRPHLYDLPEDHRLVYETSVLEPLDRAMAHWLPVHRALRAGRPVPGALRHAAYTMQLFRRGAQGEKRYGHVLDMVDGGFDPAAPTAEHDADFRQRANGGDLPVWNRHHYENLGKLNCGMVLAKMAMIHGGPDARSVWRIQNTDGLGPYVAGVPGRRSASQPEPHEDFDPDEYDILRIDNSEQSPENRFYFGFEHPDHARRWFGAAGLAKLKRQGFDLTELPAREIFRSSSGRQVMFKFHGKLPPGLQKIPRKTSMRKSEDTAPADLPMPSTCALAPGILASALASSGGCGAALGAPYALSLAGCGDCPPLDDPELREALGAHPATQFVIERYGSDLTPDHALLPAMWLHWLAAPHHQDLIAGANPAPHGAVFWDTVRRLSAQHGLGLQKGHGALHGRALQAVEAVRQRFGEIPATLAAHAHVLPIVCSAEGEGDRLAKMESAVLQLRKRVEEAAADPPSKHRIVRYRGAPVHPGLVRTTQGDFDVLHETPDHYVVSDGQPNPSLTKFPKAKEGTHFEVVHKPAPVLDTKIDSAVHGIQPFVATPEHHALLHGADVESWHAEKPGHAKPGTRAGYWVRAGNGKLAFAKSAGGNDLLAAQGHPRYSEAIFSNLADQFWGLGQHVPRTAMFEHPLGSGPHSLQEGIVGATHGSGMDLTPGQAAIVDRLHRDGTMDKLALMDMASGSWDRHGGNYVFSPANLHLIDNTSYHTSGSHAPDYWLASGQKMGLGERLGHAERFLGGQLHPEAAAWLQERDAGDFEDRLGHYFNHDPDVSPGRAQRIANRLRLLQHVASKAGGTPTRRDMVLALEGRK